MGKFTSNLYDVIPAKTQTPNIPVPNIPVRIYLPEDIPAIDEEANLPINAHSHPPTAAPTSFKSFLAQGYPQEHERELTDEYRAYCQLPTLQNKPHSLIYWWRDQEPSFPLLATLAHSILSTPAMSAECERVFSSSKLLVTPIRNRLTPQAIEVSECLRNWYRNEVA